LGTTIAPGVPAGQPEREEGQTMAEYSVALTIITILVIGDLVLSDHMRNVISTVSSVLPGH
jgi:Flp pilus assembly pilin Flp